MVQLTSQFGDLSMKQDHKDTIATPEPESLLEKIETNTDPAQVSQAVIAKILLKLKEDKKS